MAKKKDEGGTSAKAPPSKKVESKVEVNPVDQGSLPPPLVEAIDAGATVETHVEEPTRKRYVEAITSACRKAGLAAGLLLIDAKEKLKHGEFEEMIERDLPFSPRTAERLMVVARNVVLSNPTHASLLPGSWTVLHELALVDKTLDAPGTLQEWIETGVVHSKLKREEVKALVDGARDKTEDAPPPSSGDMPPNDGASPPETPKRPPKRGEPDRGDVGPDSAGEAARLRALAEQLGNEKHRLEIANAGLESEVEEARAAAKLDDDVRKFVGNLVERIAGMTIEQREELFRALYRVLADLPIPEDLRCAS
jgi:hypothetical protein